MKKGELVWLRWEDDTLQQCKLDGQSKRGWRVTWLTGPLAGRQALVETRAMKEAIDAV